MYIPDTTPAPKGSWREAKIEYALIFDIACTIALWREGDDSGDREYQLRQNRCCICSSPRRGVTLMTPRRSRRGSHQAILKTASRSASCELKAAPPENK